MRKDLKISVVVTACLLVWAMLVGMGYAKDFSTALSSTFAQIPVAADQASISTIAVEDFSSSNPAIVGAGKDYKVGAQATYGFVTFGHGPTLQLQAGSIAGRLPKDAGALQLTYVHANSGMSAIDPSNVLGFDGIYAFDLQYGKKIGSGLLLAGDELFAGVSFTHTESKLNFAFPDSNSGMATTKSKSASNAGTVGIFYKPIKDLRFGALYSKAWETAQDETYFVGAISGSEHSKSQSDTLRVGASYQLFKTTTIAGDYQHVYIKGAAIDQYSIGIEQYLIPDVLALYASCPNGGLGAGMGLYFEKGGLNIAYQSNPFSDLKPYLGGANLFMVSIYGNF